MNPSILTRLHTALADGRITRTEVDGLVAGDVKPVEREVLRAALSLFDSKFEPDAKRTLSRFLDAGSAEVRAVRTVLDAAAGGGLEGRELEHTEQLLARQYGPIRAKELMAVSLAARGPAGVTLDGAEWLQRQQGNFEGHLDTYQRVLGTHLAGAKLLDANFDGRLDASDQVFTANADGTLDVRNVGEALCDRLKIGGALVDASRDLAAMQHRFDLTQDFNRDLWKPPGGRVMGIELKLPGFVPKPGVKPSDAVRDIFSSPGKYGFECATAMVIVHYKAMLDLLGPEDFDAACGKLKIGPWLCEDTLKQHITMDGSDELAADAARRGELRAGDHTYFKNWDVTDEAREAGWQGENVIFLGAGEYYGHPFGVTTEGEIVRHLDSMRKEGPRQSASMLELQARIDSKLLQLDKKPGR